MQILVYIDDDDRKLWVDTLAKAKALLATEGKMQESISVRAAFFDKMIAKYPILKYKQIAINAQSGYIYRWVTAKDFH